SASALRIWSAACDQPESHTSAWSAPLSLNLISGAGASSATAVRQRASAMVAAIRRMDVPRDENARAAPCYRPRARVKSKRLCAHDGPEPSAQNRELVGRCHDKKPLICNSESAVSYRNAPLLLIRHIGSIRIMCAAKANAREEGYRLVFIGQSKQAHEFLI